MTDTLPLFPLGAVLLPGASMPLHIFEPRYRQLVIDLVKEVRPDRTFGVVTARQGWDMSTDDMEAVHHIGCSAVLREARQLPEGRYDIVVKGSRRFRLLGVEHDRAPYLMAEVEWLPDEPVADADHYLLAKLGNLARAAHRSYCATAWREEDWREPCTSEDIATLAHVLAEDCLLALDDRQDVLEESDPVRPPAHGPRPAQPRGEDPQNPPRGPGPPLRVRRRVRQELSPLDFSFFSINLSPACSPTGG